jgi:hypothetical protein
MTSADLDVGVITTLRDDLTLQGIARGGIYRDEAPEAVVNAALEDPDEVFGVVSLVTSSLFPSFCDAAPPELAVFRVGFWAPATNASGAQAAIDRAEVLLTGLVVPGYQIGCSRRLPESGRLFDVISDEHVRWQYRSVQWEVWASR